VAIQDPPTATTTVLPAEAIVAVHTQDLQAAVPTVPPATTRDLQAVLPTAVAIQDPPTAATAVLPAEATQAPAAVQDLAAAAIQEAVIQEAVHQEAHSLAEVVVLEAMRQEDKFKILNPKSKVHNSKHLEMGCFFV